MYQRQFKTENKENRSLFRIPISDSFILPKNKLSIDPYLFGYWIGNGNAQKPEITVMRDDVEIDPVRNIKPDKEKITEKIDSAVVTIMALDGAIRNEGNGGSAYDEREIIIL